MKYDNSLQEDIVNHFHNRDDFYYHGYTGTHWFNSWKKGEEKHIVRSKKPHGGKYSISTQVAVYSNRLKEDEQYGVEMKIDMYLWEYQTEETMFQGWVESIEELEVILKSVGL